MTQVIRVFEWGVDLSTSFDIELIKYFEIVVIKSVHIALSQMRLLRLRLEPHLN